MTTGRVREERGTIGGLRSSSVSDAGGAGSWVERMPWRDRSRCPLEVATEVLPY